MINSLDDGRRFIADPSHMPFLFYRDHEPTIRDDCCNISMKKEDGDILLKKLQQMAKSISALRGLINPNS